MPPGMASKERDQIDPDDYSSFEELPLVRTGCDSYSSWDPRFKKFANTHDIDRVVDELLKVTPNGSWTTPSGQPIHLILTGGEPLLGWQRAYIDLFEHEKMSQLRYVTFETNTTQPLNPEFQQYLIENDHLRVTFSCSPKLSVSGEDWDTAIAPQIALSYFNITKSDMYFKFVVQNEQDMMEVERAVLEYQQEGIDVPVYCMPVGGCIEEYTENAKPIADLCLKRGWRFSPRLHTIIWGNAWGT